MSVSLEKPAINPYAAPVGSSSRVETQKQTARASEQTLRTVDLLYVVADLSFVAVCGSFFLAPFFSIGATAYLVWTVYWVASFVFWLSTSVGLIKACGFGIKTFLTIFILPIPFFGTIIFLGAKQEIRLFMISNGYLPRFLGFGADAEERNAMEQDLDYRPSIYFRRDGKRRKFVFTFGECLMILCVLGLAAWFSLH